MMVGAWSAWFRWAGWKREAAGCLVLRLDDGRTGMTVVFHLENSNFLPLVLVIKLEVARLEIGHGIAVAVPDDHADLD